MGGLVRKAILIGGAAFLAVTVPACAAPPVATFNRNHVSVTVSSQVEAGGQVLVARFVPDGADLHLYGTDLPRFGIDGAGRPTLVEIVGGGWEARGPLVPSLTAVTVKLPGFDQAFSVFPDGPVELRLPIRSLGDASPGDGVEVAVTYMACTGDGRCYPPVDGAHIHVQMP